jgi:hypothetical protein
MPLVMRVALSLARFPTLPGACPLAVVTSHHSPVTQLRWTPTAYSLFARLMSHRAAVLFSHNKSATSNQSAVLFSHNKPAPAISHQPTEQAATLNTVQRQQYCAHLACFLEERLDCFSEVI